MLNFPRHINTMDDVNHLRGLFPAKLADYLEDLYNFKDTWFMTSKLADGDAGLTDATHKVVENTDQETGVVTERYQYELIEDPNGPIFRLGFATTQEVFDLIRSLRDQANAANETV